MDLGLPELLIILVIILLLFGGKRLPELSRSLGHSIRELREGFVGKESPKEPKEEASQATPQPDIKTDAQANDNNQYQQQEHKT